MQTLANILFVRVGRDKQRRKDRTNDNNQYQQPTNKSAADLVDWKFFDDYGGTDIHLDAMIASHCDADHYGGLLDLLRDDPEARKELDCRSVIVDAFYHAGVSWWRPGDRWLGRTPRMGTSRGALRGHLPSAG